GDGGGPRVIEMPGTVDLRGHLVAGDAGDRGGDHRLAEEVGLVGADAACGGTVVAGEIARGRRRLRPTVAGAAGGRAARGNPERVALLTGHAGLAARKIVSMAILASGEAPAGLADQVAVELPVMRVEDSALVDPGTEEGELSLHHPRARGRIRPRDRLVHGVGARRI